MPVKAPPVFEAEVSPADFTFHDRRGFLLGLGALLVPKRSIFLPPLGGWPELPWKCISVPGGYYYDGSLAGKLKMLIEPVVRFRDMAETAGVEPAQGVSLITGFKPDKHANACLHIWRIVKDSNLRQPLGYDSLAKSWDKPLPQQSETV